MGHTDLIPVLQLLRYMEIYLNSLLLTYLTHFYYYNIVNLLPSLILYTIICLVCQLGGNNLITYYNGYFNNKWSYVSNFMNHYFFQKLHHINII